MSPMIPFVDALLSEGVTGDRELVNRVRSQFPDNHPDEIDDAINCAQVAFAAQVFA